MRRGVQRGGGDGDGAADWCMRRLRGFESGSIQQIIYQMGQRMLAEIPAMAEVNLEANNRTWDTIAEQGDRLGFIRKRGLRMGVLGLTLRR